MGVTACAGDGDHGSPTASPPSPPSTPPATGPETATTASTVSLVAAGDLAGCEWESDSAAAELVESLGPLPVVMLGDIVYPAGTDAMFSGCFDPVWGSMRDRLYPTPGNHDYGDRDAAGYMAYFSASPSLADRVDESGGPVDGARGWYSWDLGDWHLVALNSNCAVVSCDADSPQVQWLRADLQAHPGRCTLAYWHHPRFSSGVEHGSDTTVAPLWDALVDGGADVVLNGHEHHYERFERLDADGLPVAEGVREFVVGTGGAPPYEFAAPLVGSEVRHTSVFGVLDLTLEPDGYHWRYLDTTGGPPIDEGADVCR